MKIKSVFLGSFILLLNLLFLNPSTTFAESINEESITIDNTMPVVEQQKAINEFENDPNVTELIILDETLIEDNNYRAEELTEGLIQPMAGVPRYRVTGVKNGSDYTGGAVATTSGEPGMTLAISQTKSIETTVSASFGASSKILSAGIGWNTTGSTKISISGSYKVPSKVGTKNVKTATLKAHTVYKTKKYNVQKMAWNSFSWEHNGTGTAKKAYGVSFKKSYTYK